MRINHNIASLNTYRQLTMNTTAGSKSLEKLSSGLRINRAGDDAAGLAISEKMRGQIRGLDQAARNAQDAISLIQTAEGALNETHSILQRMRELAVQAANDTNTIDDRNQIQEEINQLSSEINRIGNTTEFNTQSLLKGAGEPASITGTPNYGSTNVTDLKIDPSSNLATGNYTIDIEDGKIISTGASGGDATEVRITSGSTLADGDYRIRTSFDGATTNFVAGANGVTAVAYNGTDEADFASGYKVRVTDGGSGTFNVTILDSADQVVVQESGVAADAAQGGLVVGDFTVTADALVVGADATFGVAGQGWQATLQTSGGGAVAGSSAVNINPGQTSVDLGNGVTADFDGSLGVGEITTFSVGTGFSATVKDAEGTALGTTTIAPGQDDKLIYGGLSIDTDTTLAAGTISFGVQEKGDFNANFQIGANAGQSLIIDINDMRSFALNITGKATGTVTAKDGQVAYFVATANVTDGTNNAAVEYSLDISSSSKASAAISVLDDAINAVSFERAKLGAVQNRLEHTINNLGTSAENLTASESRIRDVDMAKEMMEFTKNSILQQAAQAMLAQANQQPQGVLQLLR